MAVARSACEYKKYDASSGISSSILQTGSVAGRLGSDQHRSRPPYCQTSGSNCTGQVVRTSFSKQLRVLAAPMRSPVQGSSGGCTRSSSWVKIGATDASSLQPCSSVTAPHNQPRGSSRPSVILNPAVNGARRSMWLRCSGVHSMIGVLFALGRTNGDGLKVLGRYHSRI
jgi:hypothetical protein